MSHAPHAAGLIMRLLLLSIPGQAGRIRSENFGVGYRFDERVFCQVFEILSCDHLCFFKRSEPPLNLKMLVSSNTFDNSTFFYEQLKFTWLVWVAIAVEFGGEIDAPSGDPITLYDTLNLTFRRP